MIKILVRVWLVLSLVAVCVATDASGYKVTRKYPVPGDGGFDYIVFDGSSNRLYVSHGTEVNVLDANSGKVSSGSKSVVYIGEPGKAAAIFNE